MARLTIADLDARCGAIESSVQEHNAGVLAAIKALSAKIDALGAKSPVRDQPSSDNPVRGAGFNRYVLVNRESGAIVEDKVFWSWPVCKGYQTKVLGDTDCSKYIVRKFVD